MKLELDPIFETFFLLLDSNGEKKQKKEVIRQLDDYGINGAAFYAAHYAVAERYFDAFADRMVETPGNAVFEDMSDELALLVIAILFLHPEWLDDFDAVADRDALAVVRDAVTEWLESGEDAIGALEASELSDRAKWQIAALLQQPKQKFALVIEAINANIAAFRHAAAKLDAEIAPLLAQLGSHVENGTLPPVVHSLSTFDPEARVVPSMAVSLVLMAFGEFCVIGLLLDKVFSDQDESLTDTEAILVAKSLSDASKLEILRTLKGGSQYNLELAQTLGLTPATISHHMSMLLSAGLVEVSKKGSRVYYRLCTGGIERYRVWLEEALL